ncbi:hypothetical protein CCUS01_00696 [Colletotrichum cuscutae]|uniref:Uncharacterized protein n=1 Tax=Colletotrichum cuscutae TaxID=1209917 RepID=A0AAI9Y653_9PEZI|nr:hypothetical protein CCUS01_00696 [Colletotrichum cuscutae]
MRHNPAVPLIGRLNVQVGVCWLTQLGLTAGIMLGWGGLPSLLRYREHWSSEPTASSNRVRSPMENMIVDHDITRKEYGLLTLIISKRRPHTGKRVRLFRTHTKAIPHPHEGYSAPTRRLSRTHTKAIPHPHEGYPAPILGLLKQIIGYT